MTDRALFVEESHDLPLVHFQVIVPTGSLGDPEGHEGLTRLCARLLRRGTKRRNTRELEEYLDALGAEVGIEVTAGFVRFSGSTITRSLEAVLQLVSEMLYEPSLPGDEFAQLKRETEASLLELTDNDQALAGMHFRRTLFAGHPYGRPSVGTKRSLDRIDLDAVVARYRRGFADATPLFGLAGDVTSAEAERLFRTHFSRAEQRAARAASVPDPVQREGRILRIVDKPERSQTQIQIGRLGTHPRDEDHVALVVGNAVFGGTFTSRLMRAVRSERGWSYGASSRLGIDRGREAFSMWTFPQASDAVACINLELELLAEICANGITDDELHFVQSYLTKSFAFASDTADKRLEQLVDVQLYDLPSDYYTHYVEHIKAVTREQVSAAIAHRLDAGNLVISAVATDADLGDALRALPGLTHSEVVAFDADAQA